jgi:hypothetical protein
VSTVIYFFHCSDSAPDQFLAQVVADSAGTWAPKLGKVDWQTRHLTLPDDLEKGEYPLTIIRFSSARSPTRVKA